MSLLKPEQHRSQHNNWLRAAVLGANDGILSTASLIIGVASSGAGHQAILIAGIAGLVAGAGSMAAGEYVSVSSQADTEKADIEREREELSTDPEGENAELATIYVSRGLKPKLAQQVANQLMAKNALLAHTRDELGFSEAGSPHPIQAALSSAAAYASGASLPLLAAYLSPKPHLIVIISVTTLVFLAILGALAAYVGGASVRISALRVTFWGALAMALTAAIGALFGTTAS